MFSIEAIPCLTALPLQARLGLLFSFSAYLRFLSTASLRVETHWFPLTLGWPLPPDSLTTGSHTSNRAGLGLGWCCLPTRPSDRPKIAAQGQVCFSPQNELTPPPKRGGDVLNLTWVCGFAQIRPAPLPELMDRKKRDIMERKGDKEDENKRQKQQKESSAAAL